MPRSAVMAGCVDFVLPPESIARELVRLARHPFTGPTGEKDLGGTEKQFEEVLDDHR